MRKWMPAVIAAVGLLGACSSGGEPKAVAEPTRWDPCSITPEQIAATGLDPDYRETWGPGISVPDWARCSFSPTGSDVPYLLNVMTSIERTIKEARADSMNLEGRNVEVDGRDAFQYKTDMASSIEDCNVAVDLSPGLVVFTLDYMHVGDGVDPCPILHKHIEDLKDSLPPASK